MPLAANVDVTTDAIPERRCGEPQRQESYLLPRTGERGWLPFWLACLLAPLPMLGPYLTGLWQLEHYQYYPLAMVAVAVLVHSRWDRRFRAPPGLRGWILIACGWASVGVAIAGFSPWLGAVGGVAIAAACLSSMREPSGRSLAVLVLPLLSVIRLPMNLDAVLIMRLQGWTTRLASWLLDLASVPHLTIGNVIELTSRELFVAEACSGIQSVFTLLFLASVIMAWGRLPLWLAPLYACVAILLAILSNSLRVALVAAADTLLGVDWATGWSHDAVGYLTLLIAFFLLWSFDQFVSALLHPMGGGPEMPKLQNNPLVDAWNRWFVGSVNTDDQDDAERTSRMSVLVRLSMGGLSVSLGAGSLWSVTHAWASSPDQRDEAVFAVAFEPAPDILRDGWPEGCIIDHEVYRDGENPRLGAAADVWAVQDGGMRYQVALGQPYYGWKELCGCYENQNWRLTDRSVLNPSNASNGNAAEQGGGEFALARFQRDGRQGYLLFSAITYGGDVSPPPSGVATAARLTRRFMQNPYIAKEEMMMLQLWMESPERLRFEDVQILRQRFLRARAEVLNAVRATVEPTDEFPARG